MAVEQRLRQLASGGRLTSELFSQLLWLELLARLALGLTGATLNPKTSVKGAP